MVVALAIVTKMGLSATPSAILFTILCYWLWRVNNQGNALAIACCLVSALLLFLSKVNYGLIMVGLVPAYGVGLLVLQKSRRIAGLLLLLGFPLLLWLGVVVWHIDLPGYLRSALELITGYNEAMFVHAPKSLVGFELACLVLLTAGFVALLGRRRLPWTGQAMILPLIGLASLLLFKNGFVRSDKGHNFEFYTAFPLLLAVWCIAWHYQGGIKLLLCASLFYPLALLVAGTEHFGRDELAQALPLRYLREAANAPWHQSYLHLQQQLRAGFPEVVLADDVRAGIGESSVDVMPCESSIAILNGLNLKQRPVSQSYSAYTPWLDDLNAGFISSREAPDVMLYAWPEEDDIDGRPAAWDESITKRALLENYTFESAFKLPMRFAQNQAPEPADVFWLRHTSGARRLVPVSTNEVSLTLDQSLSIPATTNLVFLKLAVDRTMAGQLKSFILSPSLLKVKFQYQDGESKEYRAVPPILKTGVLVNRRVESPDEIRNWLQLKADQNMPVTSISFNARSRWAFKPVFKGTLVEYRFSDSQAVEGMSGKN
jgi:hypothetical protein